ncbi:hypothetical protein J2Z65_001387 [Paenibacillus aceris]|uniref:Uncharacterized protein n=1 Tax=Paenibacillus aceris TaxID=869555 RepID=A0ABS4HU96_9BACL|nr:hypothetical protein [Paenibacillus aceris]
MTMTLRYYQTASIRDAITMLVWYLRKKRRA